MKKILHLSGTDKFLAGFIGLVNENFNPKEHLFLLTGGGMGEADIKPYANVQIAQPGKFNQLKYYLKVVIQMHRADKIILHGLFNNRLVFILYHMPWLLKKCYWIVWGGDLYSFKLGKKDKTWHRNEKFRQKVIKNIGYLVTYIKGDVELARQWYGAQGKYAECLMYTSNIYKDYELPNKSNETLTILLGNSADPTNNHSEILQQLAKFKDENIRVITPLSYGNQEYAQQVIEEGKQLLGDKYQALTEFMPFEDYLKVLADVDVAIFNHKRQQAMGNTITLLGLGKKVYMRSDVAQWQLFQDLKVQVNDVANLAKTLFEEIDKPNSSNQEIIKNYFCKENLAKQLKSYLG